MAVFRAGEAKPKVTVGTVAKVFEEMQDAIEREYFPDQPKPLVLPDEPKPEAQPIDECTFCGFPLIPTMPYIMYVHRKYHLKCGVAMLDE